MSFDIYYCDISIVAIFVNLYAMVALTVYIVWILHHSTNLIVVENVETINVKQYGRE